MGLWNRSDNRLIPYAEALAALGRQGTMSDRDADVPLERIVGSVARAGDFDASFRPRHAGLRARRERVGELQRSGSTPSPVHLIQLGELYFVFDGHHRISLAVHGGQREITARVQQICTIAYAMACLRAQHLASKAAEREFLERVPLDDALRTDLWLDEPAAWVRLGDAAEAWALRAGMSGHAEARPELAHRWWYDEVRPVVDDQRSLGRDVPHRDVEVYALALAERDRRGSIYSPERSRS